MAPMSSPRPFDHCVPTASSADVPYMPPLVQHPQSKVPVVPHRRQRRRMVKIQRMCANSDIANNLNAEINKENSDPVSWHGFI